MSGRCSRCGENRPTDWPLLAMATILLLASYMIYLQGAGHYKNAYTLVTDNCLVTPLPEYGPKYVLLDHYNNSEGETKWIMNSG